MENMGQEKMLEEKPMLELPEVKKSHTVLAIIISVVATAAIVGGGIYYWQNMQLKSAQENLATAQNNLINTEQTLKQQISDLQAQLEEKNQAITSSDEYVALLDQLNETKFKLAILDAWQVRPGGVFTDPQNKNRLYYITQDSSGNQIEYYDFTKDPSFKKDGTVDAITGSTIVYNEKLAEGMEFRGAGIVDNKFVFIETGIDDSPGPCFSNWLYKELFYIDLSATNPTRKPYTLSDEQRAAEQKKSQDCLNSLSL